jgi:hypothetical protein
MGLRTSGKWFIFFTDVDKSDNMMQVLHMKNKS